MRIARLDLLRYGKFTDQTVVLPHAPRDFHLIVGPNEAGKSTLRSAILDLLFGIETRSRYNFLHPHPEMLLGACIEHNGDSLDFQRTKARARTLRNPAGNPLPDDALSAFIGTTGRDFFDQMFGLNHERLVSGGQEILKASNDIGRMLFQSATGIDHLGTLQGALEREANTLWAKRRSSDREYYQASDELEEAESALKAATVRTRDWSAARNEVEQREAALTAAREHYRQLEQERARLDRIRRVAPGLAALQASEQALAALGPLPSMPDNASEQLLTAETAISMATAQKAVFDKELGRLEAHIAAIHGDQQALARSADIEALHNYRQQLRNHAADIAKRQTEVAYHWESIAALTRQLGWEEFDEAALAKRLPSKLVRSAMTALLRKYDVVRQAVSAAVNERDNRQAECDGLDAELESLQVGEVSAALLDALSTARALGDIDALEKRLVVAESRARRELENARHGLGQWDITTELLRAMRLSSREEIGARVQHKNQLEAEASKLADQIADVQSSLEMLALEIQQYQEKHHPVTLAEQQAARNQRDEIWQQIRDGAATLAQTATDYEISVAHADTLADKRHDKAQEVSELQTKLDRQASLKLRLQDLESRQSANAAEISAYNATWQAEVATLGLTGLPLLRVEAWRTARELTLKAEEELEDAQQALESQHKSIAQATASLVAGLRPFVESVDSMTLTGLIGQTERLVEATTRSQERHKSLLEQKLSAKRALEASQRALDEASNGYSSWQSDWNARLEQAHLPAGSDPGTVEGALSLFEQIDDTLGRMRDLRVNRITTMQRDLDAFKQQAKTLAQTIAPELLANAPDPEKISEQLAERLGRARDADREFKRVQIERTELHRNASDADSAIRSAHATVEPLLRIARVADKEALRELIQRCDQARSLQADIRSALLSLQQEGDGLSREALESEFRTEDVSQIAGKQAALSQELNKVVSHLTELAAELNTANATLRSIAGKDTAAQAEARRQAALSRMGNAVERYIKVQTAARLLRWAIERYRETQQGPMLSRAGEIFSGLTLGAFGRLSVDYDGEPLTLYGLRATGEHVPIEGMSDGTRDQLYLALRLAAVELHLEKAIPMPFIADDLVINFDDARAQAGLEALARLSEKTQVIFLSHHDHLIPAAELAIGSGLNVVQMP